MSKYSGYQLLLTCTNARGLLALAYMCDVTCLIWGIHWPFNFPCAGKHTCYTGGFVEDIFTDNASPFLRRNFHKSLRALETW